MKKKNVSRKEKGFTLIEIIAVLVLLGILAIVAIPKFLGMQDKAKDKATLAAVAEGGARIMQTGAKLLLSTGNVATTGEIIAALAGTAGADAGDFTITYVAGATNFIIVTATGDPGTAVSGGMDSRTFGIPQN